METGWRRNYLRYKSFFLNMMTQYRDRADWRVYLEILLSLATISVFSIFALRPTILTIAELIKQIEEKKATVALMDEKIQNIGKAQILFDRENAAISILSNTAIPEKPNSDVFARQIEGLSTKHQVSVENITLGSAVLKGPVANAKADAKPETEEPMENKDQYEQVDFSLIASGSIEQFESLAGFAKEFENLRLIPEISVMDLSLKEGELNNKTLFLLMEGKLPYHNSDTDLINSI